MKIIYGKHTIIEEIPLGNLKKVLIKKGTSKNKVDEVLNLCRKYKVRYDFVNTETIDSMVDKVNHQGIIAIVKEKVSLENFFSSIDDFFSKIEISDNCLFVILDSITDTGNLGAILRSCNFFKVSAVIINKRNSAPINDTVIKTSAGSANNVNIIRVVNLARAIDKLKDKGVWVYGTVVDSGNSLENITFDKKCAIVMGSEGKGIRPLVQKKCDFLVSINRLGNVDSLNVSVCTGIFLFEFRRQEVLKLK